MSALETRSRAAVILGELFAELTRRKRLKDLLDQSSPEDLSADLVRKLADGIEELAAIWIHLAPPEKPSSLEPVELFNQVQEETITVSPIVPSHVEMPIVPMVHPRVESARMPEAPKERELPSRHFVVSKQPFEIPGDGSFYCHAVAGIPHDDQPSPRPFSLEEKGIDGQRLAFAWDSGTLRYYLSVMREEQAALGRGGALLLAKQDGIRLRGTHESVVNDLRLHGIVLPFAFGTVVKGWDETQRKLNAVALKARQGLDKLSKTKRWTVVVSAQDNRFADLQQNPTLEKRRELDRHRISYSSVAGTRRIDVRELERVLNKQRRIAEGIHRELSTVSDRTEVQAIVSLQSGSSEGWKQILRAIYDVSPTMITRFYRMVTDVQYEHLLLELMIVLTGDVESISLLDDNKA